MNSKTIGKQSCHSYVLPWADGLKWVQITIWILNGRFLCELQQRCHQIKLKLWKIWMKVDILSVGTTWFNSWCVLDTINKLTSPELQHFEHWFALNSLIYVWIEGVRTVNIQTLWTCCGWRNWRISQDGRAEIHFSVQFSPVIDVNDKGDLCGTMSWFHHRKLQWQIIQAECDLYRTQRANLK